MLEQTQITDFLDHKTEQIDELVATEQRKIELLKEYRQSLISEAVTGKIDVETRYSPCRRIQKKILRIASKHA